MDERAALVEVVAKALTEPCGRCDGKGKTRHQVDRDPAAGYDWWPCMRCKGSGVQGATGTPEALTARVLAALAALAPECEECQGTGVTLKWTQVGGVAPSCPGCNGTGKSKNLAIFPVSGEVRLVQQVGWDCDGTLRSQPCSYATDARYLHQDQPLYNFVPLEGS